MKQRIKILASIAVLMTIIVMNMYSQSDKFVPENRTILKSETGLEMLNQCSREVPANVEGYYDLTLNEINELEYNFKKILNLKSTGCCYSGIKISSLDGFTFQYVGIIINGQKHVYINAFQVEPGDLETFYKCWKTTPIIICDGGESIWGAVWNVKNKKFSQLSINGVS